MPPTDQTMSIDGGVTHLEMIVAGRRLAAASAERYAVFNPANGELVGSVPCGGTDDARSAVDAAAQAHTPWREAGVAFRAAAVERALDAIAPAASDLAVLLTREQGKPLREAVAEIQGFLTRMRALTRLARETPDGRVPTLSMRAQTYGQLSEPGQGVTVGLVAWNFPIGLLVKKLGSVLLAGGTAIIKPASTTPLATLRLVEIMNDAGLPAGVLNGVTGHGDVLGAALVADPRVTRVHLTGSDATGAAIVNHSAASSLVLELAGSDAMIVCADADVPRALQAAVVGRYRNAGQACTAVKRLFVAAPIHDAFLAALAALVQRLEPGDGLDPVDGSRVRLGPLHTRALRDRLEQQLDDALRAGARIVVGGRRPADAALDAGHFFEPTLVTDVSLESRLVREEVFGPVLPVFKYRSLEDAIEQVNASPWHGGVSMWTADYAGARAVAPRIRCRQLWINKLPFGFEPAVTASEVST
jgi:succinate-semialdehyde dehydrogenase/glutarate-semialdehyde dehydrogenase